MLRLMRKKAQSWMIKILFAIIIIVFVFFYGYGRKSGEGRVVAEVNGTKISAGQFAVAYQKAYQNLARLYQSIYKDRFDPSVIDSYALRQRVLNDLVEETLLVKEAERLSLRVSQEEFQTALRATPAFQVDGKFNQQRFMAVLQMYEMSLEEFQAMEERNRLITKLTDLIGLGGVEPSDQEILDLYRLENEKINLQFARFGPGAYEGSITVDDSELESYFANNSNLFEVPPKVQAQYIVFSADDFMKAVEISPEEIREEYESNRDQYRVPKRVKVSHILIRADDPSGGGDRAEARKKAEQMLQEAEGGQDFGALAKQYSEDLDTAKEGGGLGWLTEGGEVPDFAAVAFSLAKGETSPVMESDEGFHIVKVEDVEEGRLKSLEEVRENIRNEIARAKSSQLAEEEAEEAFFAVFETKILEGYAQEKGITVKTTDLFAKNERIEAVGGSLQFNEYVFSLQEGEVSSPLRIGDKIYLAKVLKREPAQIPAFDAVKERVRTEVVREKALEKARSAAEEMLQELRAGKSVAESAAARGLKLEETGLFERGSVFVPQVGPVQSLGKDIFVLSPENPVLGKVVSYGGVFFVMALKEEEKIDMATFDAEKEEYRRRVYAEKRAQILGHWLNSIRENSEIKIRAQDLQL